jgi:hypothetical protein
MPQLLERSLWFGRQSTLDELASCFRGDIDAETDWFSVISTANEHLCAPQLLHELRASGSAARVDREALQYLEELDAAHRERNRRILTQLAEVAAAMNATGIVPMAIKGAAVLVASVESAASRRMTTDIDLLVDKRECDVAIETLRSRGYDLSLDDPGPHSRGNYYRADHVGGVDLHVKLPGPINDIVSQNEVQQRSKRVDVLGSMIRCPSPTLHFVIGLGHDILHDMGDFKGDVKLRYLLELVELSHDTANPLDWAWIDRKCTSSVRLRRGLEVQARMARRLFDDRAFPQVALSRVGWLLHQRRLAKHQHRRFSQIDRAIVRRLLYLRRRLFPRDSEHLAGL